MFSVIYMHGCIKVSFNWNCSYYDLHILLWWYIHAYLRVQNLLFGAMWDAPKEKLHDRAHTRWGDILLHKSVCLLNWYFLVSIAMVWQLMFLCIWTQCLVCKCPLRINTFIEKHHDFHSLILNRPNIAPFCNPWYYFFFSHSSLWSF